MSWKKHFTPVPVNNEPGSYSPLSQSGSSRPGPARANYSSFLPEVYTGAPNRVERYLQYSTMDMDSEINAALDILAEFCSQKNKENRTPFYLHFKSKATNTEIAILREYLQQWCKLQQFETRIFRIVRNVFKNGDCFFVRDPETQKWHYIDPAKLVKIIVNESDGKLPEQYVIRDLSPNFQNLVVTAINPSTTNTNNRGTSYVAGGSAARGMIGAYPANPSSSGSRFVKGEDEVAIESRHIVHLSLSEGLDNNYPFGNSILETIFKVYKQKELLEDALLIYRISRAPERRIFYIDVGNMPSHLAMSFVERVKNEINQRRIPSATGGGSGAVIDSAYNPLSINEDFYFPTSSEGRGSKVDTLPGGCFSMDTKVSLLDGRELSIRDIENELKSGKELWTYSCEPKTGKIVPGLISWAGVTHKSAKVMRLTLDNGEEIICTPCHKFPQYNEEFKRAGDFKVGDSLIPLYRKVVPLYNSKDHEQYFDNSDKTWKYTHRMVAENRKQRSEDTSKQKYKEWENNDERLEKHSKSQTFEYSHEMLKFIINMVKGKEVTVEDVTDSLNKDQNLLSELIELNKDKKVRNWSVSDGFKVNVVRTLVKRFGYKNWTDFRKKESIHNHQIVKIEYLDDEIEVGTLTIDAQEVFHDYHTFALSVGVMVFNSNLGEINDLQYFTNKLFRGLRIPSSYLPTGAEDSGQQYNDGRVGTAYIQELRFNNYCMRLQSLIQEVFDQEFKLYLYNRGVNIDTSLFDLKLQEPQNFATYRQAELDNQRIPSFTQMINIPIISKRFALKRFLGLSDEDMAENERLWAEEKGETKTTATDSAAEMRNVGINQAGIQSDMSTAMGSEIPAEDPTSDVGTPGQPGAEPQMGAETQG